jgi:ribosome biogenesis protein UTP30
LDGDDDDQGDGARSNPQDVVWLQVTVKTLNVNAPAKPIRLPTPHVIYPHSSSVCLLSADPQREYKDLLVEHQVTSVKRVVGVKKLKGKFQPYEARRQLMNDHDVFLADDRIVPMLPKLLGKKWMAERKTPIPVRVSKKNDIKSQIRDALAATYFHRNKGTCTSVRIGTLRHLAPAQLAENVAATLPVIVGKHVKGGWSNVLSIDIKTGTSAALPVFNCKLGERWQGMPNKESGQGDHPGPEDGQEEAPAAKKAKNL